MAGAIAGRRVRRCPAAVGGDLASQPGGAAAAAAAGDPLPFPQVRRRTVWPTSCTRERMRAVRENRRRTAEEEA